MSATESGTAIRAGYILASTAAATGSSATGWW